jgi:HEAT repeat protein
VIQLNDLELRLVASGVLGFSGQKAAVPFLLSTLTDQNDMVKSNALLGIGLIGDKGTPISPLINALSDKSPLVRGTGAFAISRVVERNNPRGAVAPLVKMLNDTEPSVRNETIRALAVCGDSTAVESLINKGLSDEYELIVINAVLTLGILKDHRAIEPLIKVSGQKDNPSVKEAVLSALNYITDKQFESIADWQVWWDKNKP